MTDWGHSEAESFYDEEIAPVLLELGKRLTKRGMSMFAVVEYEKGERASTIAFVPTVGLEMQMVRHCNKTAPNVDSYMIGLTRHANELGIDIRSSIYLSRFGGHDAPQATKGSEIK